MSVSRTQQVFYWVTLLSEYAKLTSIHYHIHQCLLMWPWWSYVTCSGTLLNQNLFTVTGTRRSQQWCDFGWAWSCSLSFFLLKNLHTPKVTVLSICLGRGLLELRDTPAKVHFTVQVKSSYCLFAKNLFWQLVMHRYINCSAKVFVVLLQSQGITICNIIHEILFPKIKWTVTVLSKNSHNLMTDRILFYI